MYVLSRQGYNPPVKSTGRGKKYSHFASLKYCNGAETFYTVSYHAYIPLLKFNNIVMDKIIKILSSIICFFCFVIYEFIDYLNIFFVFFAKSSRIICNWKKMGKNITQIN